ncbi:Winged helix-turn-helix DNA-binding [Rathayibacter rathayi NCPPB 2980 = VKM Ac-1601]|uniref:Helix-turn-helix domain-containing protein n=1 Tax=Rathayibacter rathayi TaxID=33887 RepID=A0ABX5A9A3_RATRA|nr:helix-turn-helix domain-containing protein [Rathayibacter rathayi]MWV76047.1 winged helix-turn-helix transcriptional regulator [Rathayibacter rathayi NCPPB 2980 = VKM Ac-1601]PPG65153.1 helix-turn-helix domain-containing protein [Rathayibacter rathayi]PPG74206.1 helix-turn-helix domain-containing protein [Rathayibacter rathayi]PPG87533.1 helix-turn-helix domain-containing protein [Rathayibacter rathayi]PPG95105.1 helix-turn-helix domain-containing protein [Rathayibacter rathayi]
MGHTYDLSKYSDDGYRDVTGTDYALGRDADCVAGVALEAKLRSEAARDAYTTVLDQAIAALRDAGLSIREIAGRLDLSKSHVARRLRRGPYRSMPQPEIDSLVEAVWTEGLQRVRERLAPREGDVARPFTYSMNILISQSSEAPES